MERQTQAYLYATATIAFWSTAASAFKLTLGVLSPAELLFYASGVSTLALALILVARGTLGQLRTWGRRDLWHSAVLGFLNPFLYYLVLFKAYDLLPAQEAQPLNYTWPVVLVLVSVVVLRQPVRPATVLAMAVSFAGVLVISTRGDVLGWRVTDPLGVGLALGSTLIWALYWTFNVRDRRDPVARLFLSSALGFVLVAAYLLLTEGLRPPPLAGLVGGAYVGLFEMGITFVAWLQALKLSRSTAQVSNFIFLTPFLSLIVIYFVVGEPIYPSTLIGLVLIVTGIALQQYLGRGVPGRARA